MAKEKGKKSICWQQNEVNTKHERNKVKITLTAFAGDYSGNHGYKDGIASILRAEAYDIVG